MRINLKKIKYYYLTVPNKIRKEHIIKEFKEYDLTEVNPVLQGINISKVQSGATGMSRILDLALQNQDRKKPFQPFVIFEDDVKKYREFPVNINIPDDADIFYIGLSKYGLKKSDLSKYVSYNHVDNDIIKVNNMLALHGLIICSMRGLLAFQKCLFEDFFNRRGYDIAMAHMLPHINAYAFRKPLVYQYYKIGGQERPTKIEFLKKNVSMPYDWINRRNISIVTNYKKANSDIRKKQKVHNLISK